MLNILEVQKKLTAVALPSGFECPQAKVLEELAKPYCDEMWRDTLGNVICHVKGKGKKLMMPAHMDVIGFLAVFIDEKGFIRFETIGGHMPAAIINAPIRFENGVKGCIRIDSAAAEMPKKPLPAVDLQSLYIDIGAKDKAEAESLVKIGSVAVFDVEPVAIAGNNMMTPYADDLAACIVLLIAMEKVKNSPNDLYFVFSTQEERGLIGARVAAFNIQPDMGIAVDLTRTGDTPGETVQMEVAVGKGPTIKIKDSSLICNPQVVAHLRKAAEKAGIAYQDEILLAGGTDGAAMQTSRAGVLSGVISIPGRNIHSPGEIINLKDLEQCGLLLAEAAMMEI